MKSIEQFIKDQLAKLETDSNPEAIAEWISLSNAFAALRGRLTV